MEFGNRRDVHLRLCLTFTPPAFTYTTGVRQFYTTSRYTTRPRGYTFHLPIKCVPSRSLSVTMCLGPWVPGSLGPSTQGPCYFVSRPLISYLLGHSQSKKTQAKAKTSRHKRKQNQAGKSKARSKHKQSKGHKQTQKQAQANKTQKLTHREKQGSTVKTKAPKH